MKPYEKIQEELDYLEATLELQVRYLRTIHLDPDFLKHKEKIDKEMDATEFQLKEVKKKKEILDILKK